MTSRKRPTILLVEDDPAVLRLVRTHLEALPATVREAQDGEQAIHALDTGPCDLLCVDLILPVTSGFQVCEHVQSNERLRGLPVIAISTRNQPEDRAWALELGAAAYFVKPFTPTDLVSKVRELLADRLPPEYP